MKDSRLIRVMTKRKKQNPKKRFVHFTDGKNKF